MNTYPYEPWTGGVPRSGEGVEWRTPPTFFSTTPPFGHPSPQQGRDLRPVQEENPDGAADNLLL